MTSSTFETPPGGVMTVDVGAITGSVTIIVQPSGNGTEVTAAYEGSDDVYTVQGSPLAGDVSLDQVTEHLQADPGVDSDDNAKAADLNALRAEPVARG